MANRYWVGGNANWDNTAGTKWALTSGGAGGQAVPTTSDDVFLDNGAGTGNVTISGSRSCKSLTCTGYVGTLAGTSSPALTVAGGGGGPLLFVSGMTLTFAGMITFNSGSCTVTSAGKTIAGGITVNGATAAVTLADNANFGSGAVTLTQGTLNDGGFTVACGSFAATGTSSPTLTKSGTWTISGTGTAWSISSTPENVTINDSGITQFSGASQTIVTGEIAFNNIKFTNATPAVTITGGLTASNCTITGSGAVGLSGAVLWDVNNLTANTSIITFTGTGDATFENRGETIANLTINKSSGNFTLLSALTASGTITLTDGVLIDGGFAVSAAAFDGSNSTSREIDLTAAWTLTGTGTVWNLATTTNLTVTNLPSTIKLTNSSASSKTFAGGGLSYNNFWNATGSSGVVIITGSNTFSDFKTDASRTTQFTAGTTNAATTWTLGAGGTITSVTSAAHTLSRASGSTVVTGTTISWSIGTGGATWNALATSNIDAGNNTGWLFWGRIGVCQLFG